MAPRGIEGASPAHLRRFHRGRAAIDQGQRGESAASRHPRRQQRWIVDGRGSDRASRAVQRRCDPEPVARHEALQPSPRRRELDGGIRRSRQAGGVGVYLAVLTVPESAAGDEVSDGAVRDDDARRPRASRACAQDGGEDGIDGDPILLLREHGGRPRRGRDKRAAGKGVRADLRLPVATAALARPDDARHFDDDAVALQTLRNSGFGGRAGVCQQHLDATLTVAQTHRCPHDARQHHQGIGVRGENLIDAPTSHGGSPTVSAGTAGQYRGHKQCYPPSGHHWRCTVAVQVFPLLAAKPLRFPTWRLGWFTVIEIARALLDELLSASICVAIRMCPLVATPAVFQLNVRVALAPAPRPEIVCVPRIAFPAVPSVSTTSKLVVTSCALTFWTVTTTGAVSPCVTWAGAVILARARSTGCGVTLTVTEPWLFVALSSTRPCVATRV